jgi:hypothetical protein
VTKFIESSRRTISSSRKAARSSLVPDFDARAFKAISTGEIWPKCKYGLSIEH